MGDRIVAFAYWMCVAIIGYVYAGYPAMLWLVTRLFRKPIRRADITPRVTVAIAAYNEEVTIAGRIENCLALDYPRDRLEILIASDGSTDRTAEIVRSYADCGVRLLDLPRGGKALADNELVGAACGDIVVTSSAAGRFAPDALRKLVRHFADPEIGCVTGLFRASNSGSTNTSANEAAYWRYEMWLRALESKAGLLAVAGGVCLAFRRELYRPLVPSSDADNMVPLHVLAAGKRVVFEPEAVAYDEAIETPEQQLRNRIRQVTKSQRDTFRILPLLSPVFHPGPAFSLWSHKVLRWWVPFFALAALIANLLLLGRALYRATMLLQIGFYAAAISGYFLQRRRSLPRPLLWPTSFFTVNLASLIGTVNFVRGREIHLWETRTVSSEGTAPAVNQ